MCQFFVSNLEQIQKKMDTKAPILDRKISDDHSILCKDHTTSVQDPRYARDYQIISFPGKAQIEMVDSKGTDCQITSPLVGNQS